MDQMIERTLELRAGQARVWEALTDAKELRSWFPENAELDLRLGGEGWFTWAKHGHYHVRVEEFDPPRRFVWRWARSPETRIGDGESTLVEWTLTERAGGGTTLFLRESGFTDPSHLRGNDHGWTEELAKLTTFVDVAGVAGR
jgi:uncharacterized protein YndB with AHSA1/START domain